MFNLAMLRQEPFRVCNVVLTNITHVHHSVNELSSRPSGLKHILNSNPNLTG